MTIGSIMQALEQWAPLRLQEEYDNAGLITGNPSWNCTGILVSLDATETVVQEAINQGCNLVVSHHPIVFRGLKKINGKNYVERSVIKAIKHDIALFAIHTNLDNVLHGVNGSMADRLGLLNRQVLQPKRELLEKMVVFVPLTHREPVLQALFAAGAGQIGLYDECSFTANGQGTFRASETANPYVGEKGQLHTEAESRIEVIYPVWLQKPVIKSLLQAHPYEEVAYDCYPLSNEYKQTGSGLIGELPEPVSPQRLMNQVSRAFEQPFIRFAAGSGREIRKIALCGGAGSFLIGAARAAGADAFITADLKYHEFFDAENDLLLLDIGHFESEQFTIDLIIDFIREKFPNFAVRKSGEITNPVQYFKP
ncbi:MAG TPA: Nif3-like dinuclear metal center hexameric protein [Ferruginibacter sp.]|nr:Nif3-like dinuclear metal center hexameric protein [Ferruginibacter sp.]